MVQGIFFPFLWQPPRPNLITYNFISTLGRNSFRSGQPAVLKVQPPLFGVQLPVVSSRTPPNTLENRLPVALPLDIDNQNVFGSIPFGRRDHYDVPFDAFLANYLRSPIPRASAQPSNFIFRTPLNIPSVRPARPELPRNLLIPPNIVLRIPSSPSKPFPHPGMPPNLLIPPNILFRSQPPTPRSHTPFNIPFPFSFRLL